MSQTQFSKYHGMTVSKKGSAPDAVLAIPFAY